VHAVEARGLVKTYPAHRGLKQMLASPFSHPQVTCLDGVDLELGRGEIVGIIGANGAGKTTLLKTIATIVSPSAGTITVNGWNVEKNPHQVKAAIAYTFNEDRSFYWRLTGRQNLEFFAALDNLRRDTARRLIGDLSDGLNIAGYLDKQFSQYSTGIRQRFALARALLRRPSVLLLDEPTRSLDPIESRSARSLIKCLAEDQGVSVLLVTHRLEEAVADCDRIQILSHGKLSSSLTTEAARCKLEALERIILTVDGFCAVDLARVRDLAGIRDVMLSERPGGQQLEVICEDADSVLPYLITATVAAGAHVRSLERRSSVIEMAEAVKGSTNGAR
jgi:ABC-2 type transport system ATP-binding protein